MLSGYPIVLDPDDLAVVIVGGGKVALRKVQGLLACGVTDIRVVSPQFDPEMPAAKRVEEKYRPEHLQGARLVFAATDSAEVNDAVTSDAKKIGALVCRADADDENAGDFTTPAMIRQGSLLLTVSSGSPALSAMIRDKISQAMDPRWQKMADAMQTLRPMIKEKVPMQKRAEIFRQLATDEAMDQLSAGGLEQLKNWLVRKMD